MYEAATTGDAGHGEAFAAAPVTEDELVALSQQIDRFEAARVMGLVGFFAADGHRGEGFPTKGSWMRARLGLAEPATRALLVRVARMGAWPAMAALWHSGELTGAQVETVVRLVPKGLVELYAEHDSACSPVLVGLSVADTKVVVDEWVARADAVASADPSSLEGPPVVPPSEAQWARTLDDRAEQRANFAPGDATVVETALRVAETADESGEVRTAAQRRGDAWVRMARFFLDHHANPDRRPGRQHPHILVTVDLDGLAASVLWGAGITTGEQLHAWCAVNGYGAATRGFLTHALARGSTAMRTLEGRTLTPEVVNDLFGEGTTLARSLLAEGQVIDHGRSIRLATPTLRDAILARDGTCRFPGCDAPAAWADIHHIRAWAEGGTTDIAELVALCGAHHGLVHRRDHGLTVTTDGTAVFTFPDRAPVCSPPPRRTRPPRLPLQHPRIDALTPDPFTPPVMADAVARTGDATDSDEPRDDQLGATTDPEAGQPAGRGEDGELIDVFGTTTHGHTTTPADDGPEPNAPTAATDPVGTPEMHELAEIPDELTAYLTGPELGPHDDDGEPLGDHAVDDLIRARAHRLVRAA